MGEARGVGVVDVLMIGVISGVGEARGFDDVDVLMIGVGEASEVARRSASTIRLRGETLTSQSCRRCTSS